MQMFPQGALQQSCFAHGSNGLAQGHLVPGADRHLFRQTCIDGDIPVLMADDHGGTHGIIFVNGVKIDSAIYDNVDTPQGALEAIISSVMNDVSKLSVRIYKDEAMTQEITMDNVTKDDIMTLENVYLNVTPNDCALVIAKHSEKDAYSKPYKIVAPFLSMLGFNSSEAWTQPISCPEAGEYELDAKSVSSENCEIWVNGVKQDPKKSSITVENGKIYIVEYVTIASENNM